MDTSEARSVGIARPDLIDLALAIDIEVQRDQSPTVGIAVALIRLVRLRQRAISALYLRQGTAHMDTARCRDTVVASIATTNESP